MRLRSLTHDQILLLTPEEHKLCIDAAAQYFYDQRNGGEDRKCAEALLKNKPDLTEEDISNLEAILRKQRIDRQEYSIFQLAEDVVARRLLRAPKPEEVDEATKAMFRGRIEKEKELGEWYRAEDLWKAALAICKTEGGATFAVSDEIHVHKVLMFAPRPADAQPTRQELKMREVLKIARPRNFTITQ